MKRKRCRPFGILFLQPVAYVEDCGSLAPTVTQAASPLPPSSSVAPDHTSKCMSSDAFFHPLTLLLIQRRFTSERELPATRGQPLKVCFKLRLGLCATERERENEASHSFSPLPPSTRSNRSTRSKALEDVPPMWLTPRVYKDGSDTFSTLPLSPQPWVRSDPGYQPTPRSVAGRRHANHLLLYSTSLGTLLVQDTLIAFTSHQHRHRLQYAQDPIPSTVQSVPEATACTSNRSQHCTSTSL